MKSALVFSWITIGNVPAVVAELRSRDLRPVLVSELPDDPHAALCEEHVLLDWDREDLATLVARLDERGIVPVAVVNMVDKLISWHAATAAHYGLPGGDAGRAVLASKLLVRERMRALGLSAMRFCADDRGERLDQNGPEVDFFPAIVKPARVSGASFLVRRVDTPAELLAYRRHRADRGFADLEMIVEEFLPGTEFSVDGPVIAGRFHLVLAVEKPDHDDVRHHDAGLRIHPPQREHVKAGVRALTEALNTLCTDLSLDGTWLHVEGRAAENGRTELVEINLRFGGGMYPTVLKQITGLAPMRAFVSMALGEFTLAQLGPPRPQTIGWVDVETDRLGRVETTTTADDLRAIPGVIEAVVVNGYRATDMERENYFLKFVMVADSEAELRKLADRVMDAVDYRIVA